MIQDNLFNYKKFLYLKLTAFLIVACALAYAFHQPAITANGGTWLGYTLGTVGALLIVWLMWLGVRKRQYGNPNGPLRGWVSAHVYLGFGLAVVATLHTGFQLGLNIHTLAYVLTLATIASGVWGLAFYMRYPMEMSNTLNRRPPEQLVEEIEKLDKQANRSLASLPEQLVRPLQKSLAQGIFNKAADQRRGACRDCATRAAVDTFARHSALADGLNEVYTNQVQRLRLLDQLRRYYGMRYWLSLWLAVHVPLACGLLAALLAHVFSVFIYW